MVRLTLTYHDQSEVGGKIDIVREHRVQRKLSRPTEINDFGAGGLEFPAHCFVLSLRGEKIWSLQKAELSPMAHVSRLIPARILRRAHQHAILHADPGSTVEMSRLPELQRCRTEVNMT